MKDFRTDAEKLESIEMLARARANAVKVSESVYTDDDDDGDEYDDHGYDREGLDKEGYNIDGVNVEGELAERDYCRSVYKGASMM